MLLQLELDGHLYHKIAVKFDFLELLCTRCEALDVLLLFNELIYYSNTIADFLSHRKCIAQK